MSPIKKKITAPAQASKPQVTSKPQTAAKPAAKRGRKPKIVTTVEQKMAVRPGRPTAIKPTAVRPDIDKTLPASAALAPKPVAPKPVAPKPKSVAGKKHFYAVGRRKEAIAQVRLLVGKGEIKVNNLQLQKYFPTIELQSAALAPLTLTNQLSQVDANIRVYGGGKRGQADSVRHGLSRALVLMNAEFRPTLKKMGFLTRDARVKERKKYGLKGARRAPQWQKR